MTTNHANQDNAEQPGPEAPVAPVAIGSVVLDLARLTVDELARLFAAVKAEIQRRHAERQRTHGGE